MGEIIIKCLAGIFVIYFTYYVTFVQERNKYGRWGMFSKFKKTHERIILALPALLGLVGGCLIILDGLRVISIESWFH